MGPKINKISDKTENTTEKNEENDFNGFLEDDVKEHRNALSHKVAILKKKQDPINQCVQAEPCSSSSNVNQCVQAEPCSSSSNVNTSTPNISVYDEPPISPPPNISVYDEPPISPPIYVYDEHYNFDLFEDFFEAIETGDNALRHYFEMYEEIIFNNDPAILEKLCGW